MSEYVVVEGDTSINDTLSSTPEGSAALYYSEGHWMGNHADAPPHVTVALVGRPTYAELAAGHAKYFTDDLASQLMDIGGEFAEDACMGIEHESAVADLEALLAPMLEAWLRRHVEPNGGLRFYSLTDTQELPRPYAVFTERRL